MLRHEAGRCLEQSKKERKKRRQEFFRCCEEGFDSSGSTISWPLLLLQASGGQSLLSAEMTVSVSAPLSFPTCRQVRKGGSDVVL